MEDLNKITSTRVGDSIHFFVNGKEDNGTVVKMDTSYVTVVKRDGKFQDIHINDTFFIKDILVNKTWNDMSMEERTVELHKVHAYSPRFLAKSWKELPQSLKDVMKSNVEDGAYGTVGQQPRAGVDTNQKDDAPDDYEGQTEDEKKEQFKHEKLKPTTTDKSSRARYGGNQLSGTTLRPSDIRELQDLETTGEDAVPTSETKYFGANGKQITREEHDSSSDVKQSYGSMQEQLWEEWLDKGEGGMGDGSAPANNGSSSTNESGMYNPVHGEKGRHGGQGRDKEEETEKDKEADEKERKG